MQMRTAPSSGGVRASGHKPNYAARRMLASTIGVAVLVAAGVLIWRATRDGSAEATPETGRWNEVVFVDRSNGAVTSVTPDGHDQGAVPATARTLAVYSQGSRVALVQDGQIVLTDLGDEAPEIVTIDPNSVVSRLAISDSLWLAVSKSTGGNLVMVDGLTGTSYDFAALAEQASPRFYVETLRFDDTGKRFAVADANTFQTVVIDTTADPPVATFFAAQPLALDDKHVVTSQVVGPQADLSMYDYERSQLARVTDGLPAGGTLVGDDVVVASVDGAVSRFGSGDEAAERIGAIAVPAGATITPPIHPSADATRMVVFGGVFEAVVDLDGRTVFTTTFTASVDEPRIEPGWTCLPVGGGSTYHSIVELETGEQLADLSGLTVTGVSADGCTVVGTRAGASEVVGDGGSVPLGRVRTAPLAPDGKAVVVQTTTGATQLLPIDDDWTLGAAVDLTAVAPANALVTFRQR
jgi:hypothetical protein